MKNANKVKNELKLNVDEQQDVIKHFFLNTVTYMTQNTHAKIRLGVKYVINHLHEKVVGKTF